MQRLAILLLLGLSIALPGATRSENLTIVLDPDQSQVTFELGATGHDVHGLLHLSGGVLRFDPAEGTVSGHATLDARLTESGNKKRDRTMHRKVLESEAHPDIVFTVEDVEGQLLASGVSEVELVGQVELLGVLHPMRIPLHLEIDGSRVHTTTHFEVPYVDWGLHNPSALVLRVAKFVEVSVDATGELTGPIPASTER